MNLYLEVSFIDESRLGIFATKERVLEVLKNIPEANLSDKESNIILSLIKHDNNNLYDWRDFLQWAHPTLFSFCRERAVAGFEKKSSDTQFNIDQLKEKRIKTLTEMAVKLLKVVKLRIDEKDKKLQLYLPGK